MIQLTEAHFFYVLSCKIIIFWRCILWVLKLPGSRIISIIVVLIKEIDLGVFTLSGHWSCEVMFVVWWVYMEKYDEDDVWVTLGVVFQFLYSLD